MGFKKEVYDVEQKGLERTKPHKTIGHDRLLLPHPNQLPVTQLQSEDAEDVELEIPISVEEMVPSQSLPLALKEIPTEKVATVKKKARPTKSKKATTKKKKDEA